MSKRKNICYTMCLIRKVQVQGLCFLKTKEFTIVNDCFQKVHNAEIGLFYQALNEKLTYRIICVKSKYLG
jgi:hypothetical protein